MFGINRTIVENETVGFEYLRIEVTPQGIIYYASPEGRYPPTPFRLTRLSGQLAIFANAGHDSPVRIMYRREGDALFGGIEGEEDGEMKSSGWSWHLVRP